MMKIALIGTSGVGKSVCLKLIGHHDAEMDRGLDAGTPQSADAMLSWIVDSPAPIVVMSVHHEGLKELAALKKASADRRISSIRFVYLFCEKEELERRLRIPANQRSPSNIKGTLNGFDEMDRIFRDLMDERIDTTKISVHVVADRVKALHLANEPTKT
jgi:hypothetical protein